MKKRARRPRSDEPRSTPRATRGGSRPQARGESRSTSRAGSRSSSRSRQGTHTARPRDRPTPVSATADRILQSQPWHLVAPELRKAGADVVAVTDQLRRYAKLLIEWNRGVSNLISRNDEARIVERHFLESLTPAYWLKERGITRWIDFGSGAGLPAIPLALAGVGGQWTLVEARRTKALFLRKVIENLELEGFEIIHDRLQSLLDEPARHQAFEGFTSRATLKLGPTLQLAADLIAPGGAAFLWKGSGREEELAHDDRWREAWDLDGLLGVGSGLIVVARFTRKS